MSRLSSLFAPASIAIVGASPRENTLGNNVVVNLSRFGYGGKIFPVHPSAPEVAGHTAYPSFAALPAPAECAVLAVPADKIGQALEEGAANGLKAAVVFASGFAELGAEGRARQQELTQLCHRLGITLCGPNCLGLVSVHNRVSLYSSGIPEGLRAGGLSVVSHSGSACIALSTLGRFGLSNIVSVGNAAVLDMADYLEHLATDPETHVVTLFVEMLRDPDHFARAARAMRDAGKSIVALKVGRTEKGAAATAAHTGSLAGNWEAYRAFFRRTGVIAVDDFDELAEQCALMLKVRQPPKGRGVAMIAVSGGETSLVSDLAHAANVHLPDFAPATLDKLRGVLPSFANLGNPLDTTDRGVYDSANVYSGAIRALAADPAVSMIAVVQDCSPALSTRGAGNYRRIADTVAAVSREIDKPVAFFNPTAGGMHPHVIEPFAETNVAVMQGARASLLAIGRMMELADFAEPRPPQPIAPLPEWQKRLASGQPFSERESKAFLAAHGIRVTREQSAATLDAAVAAADAIGYPVVMKIDSADLPHKTEVGGVRVGLADAAAVDAAFAEIMANARRHAPDARIDGVVVQEMVAGGVELIAGLNRQEPFGMGLVTGMGGVLVELLQDAASDLCPIGPDEARGLIDATRAAKLLAGYRGKPAADADAFSQLLSRLSLLGAAYADHLQSIDLNPVSVLPAGQGAVVLDALIIPATPDTKDPA